jgi:hypothetical protein
VELDSILKKIEEKKRQSEIAEQVVIERVDDYKVALNRIFSSPDGKYFAKYLLKYINLFNDNFDISNPAKLIEEKARRAVYLKMIRPYLDVEIRKEIENL